MSTVRSRCRRPLGRASARGAGGRRRSGGWWLFLFLPLACQRPTPTPLPPPPVAVPPAQTQPAERRQPVTPPAPRPEPRRQEPAPEPAAGGPLLVRVGLASDLSSLEFPCCQPRVRLPGTPGPLRLDAAVRIEPAVESTRAPLYRLQVAALKNEQQANGIRERLQSGTGKAADVFFDAGTDLYRVRWGRFEQRAEAEAARVDLERLGITSSWVVSEGAPLEHPAIRLIHGGKAHRIDGRWLELSTLEGSDRGLEDGAVPIRSPYGSFRGRLLIFLNQRGKLNLINELAVEAYLRGVVPKEMGPELYNEFEALKAQTVAARTFTVRNLGEFAAEGYDICSTPRCQVYGGVAVEHPVSDRAIRQTGGQVVLYAGEPAETFYSATCGGHTENVEVVFPLKRGPYLRGVPCVEASVSHLDGAAGGRAFPDDLMRDLLPPSPGPAARTLAARLEHLALKAGLPVPRDQLRSVERNEVLRFVASVFDMRMDRRLLSSPHRLAELSDEGPDDWRPADQRLARNLLRFGLFEGADERLLTPRETEQLLFQLALYLGWVEERPVAFLALEDGRLRVRESGGRQRLHDLPADLATFRHAARPVAEALQLLPGDRLNLYLVEDRLRAAIQMQAPRPVWFGRRAPKQSWDFFRTDQQLRQAVQSRYPGFPFRDFEVVERGISGRVGKLKLLGNDGSSLLVEGLAVRWTLDIPDTWFDAERLRAGSPAGRDGWRFRGRGWGHGVGMCQAGAFGMAMRGHGYRDILEHYYSGVELGQIKHAAARPRPFTTAP